MTVYAVQPVPSPPAKTTRAALLASAPLTIMAAAIISPSLPEMQQVFGADSGVLVRLSLTVTSLAIAVSAPMSGALADRFGRKPLLVGALALYAIAGTAGLYAQTLPILILTRAALGLAVGGIMTAISALITDLFDGAARARFLGLQAAFASIGGVVFLPLAGALAGIGWRVPFALYAVSAVILPLAAVGIRERPRTHRQPATSVRPTASSDSRVVAGVYAVALLATLVFFMAPTQLPFLLERMSVAPVLIGIVVATSTASSAVAALRYARVRERRGFRAITILSVFLLGVGWLIVGLTAYLPVILTGALVGGIGVGLAVPNFNTWLSELAPPQRRGRVLGGLVTAIFLGQFLSPLALAPLIDAIGITSSFLVSGAITAGVAVVAAAPTALARRRPR